MAAAAPGMIALRAEHPVRLFMPGGGLRRRSPWIEVVNDKQRVFHEEGGAFEVIRRRGPISRQVFPVPGCAPMSLCKRRQFGLERSGHTCEKGCEIGGPKRRPVDSC